MKKKVSALFGILLVSGLLVGLFQSCDKDTFCYLDVTVEDSQTLDGLPNDSCAVAISGGSSHNDVGDTVILPYKGTTHSFTFSAPAILTITSRIRINDTTNNRRYYYREGKKSVRLKEGERVAATVIVSGTRVDGYAAGHSAGEKDRTYMWNFETSL